MSTNAASATAKNAPPPPPVRNGARTGHGNEAHSRVVAELLFHDELRQERRQSWLSAGVLGGAVAAALLIGGGVTFLVMKGAVEDRPVIVATRDVPVERPSAAPAASSGAPKAVQPAHKAEAAAPEERPKAVERVERAERKVEASRSKAEAHETATEHPAAAAPERHEEKATAKAAKADDLDSLLDGVIDKSKAAPKPKAEAAKPAAAPPAEALGGPALTQGQLRSGMTQVNGKVHACYEQFKKQGVAKVKVVIQPSGRVKEAHVSGDFTASSDTGQCVEAAVKKASFPSFVGSPFTFEFPFVLR